MAGVISRERRLKANSIALTATQIFYGHSCAESRIFAVYITPFAVCITPKVQVAGTGWRAIELSPVASSLEILNKKIIKCNHCPRLREHCTQVGREKRRAYLEWEYWAKPVPSFGDPKAAVLVLGLAPGAHGSNRTGRPFTGDASGNFLYPVLHATGFASQPQAEHRNDGLKLRNAYITSVARCAPPGNKPSVEELENCAPYLDQEIAALTKLKVIVCLGKIAFDGLLAHLRRNGTLASRRGYTFSHGAEYRLPDGRWIVASYHPSQQNTQTGKLTKQMFTKIFVRARELAGSE